eukprot:TRINITY_DN7668_c0_g1_i1.p1 TRINITY_DN7668_c0_g1~~TRINITY_DN7668_c0_g1_i1.p1  ORF type:complete len:309 (-),score=99.70 TRINITY_DN7668_c0_g1_i1:46-972(-)
MNSASLLVLFCILSIGYSKQLKPGQSTEFSFNRPEGTREFFVYAPSSFKSNSTHSYPLVIFFHGLGADYNMAQRLGVVDEAMKGGYILIAGRGTPSVIPNIKGKRSWNAGVCCTGGNPGPDDVTFARTAISMVQAVANINKSRIFVMGQSNGGFMTDRLACEAGDLWAAAASHSGCTILGKGGKSGLDQCDKAVGNHKFSYLHLHGLDDPTVPWAGLNHHHGQVMHFPPTLEVVSRWANRLGCNGGVSSTYRNDLATNLVFKGCRNGGVAELMTGSKQTHDWWTFGNFSSHSYIFEFFKNAPKKQFNH